MLTLMHPKKRVVILGGGIAGLRTALLIKKHIQANAEVTLLDRGLLGGEASILNGQTLHTGAAYVFTQPSVAAQCRAASALVGRAFAPYVGTRASWYLVRREDRDDFIRRCQRIGIPSHDLRAVGGDELGAYLRPSKVGPYQAVQVPEDQVDTRMMIADLAQRCVEAGVRVRTRTEVRRLVLDSRHRVTAVETEQGELVPCDHCVLAAGSGTPALIAAHAPEIARGFTSVLSMHVLIRDTGIDIPIRGNLVDMPVVIPHGVGLRPTRNPMRTDACVGAFGQPQPSASRLPAGHRDFGQVARKLEIVNQWFLPDVVDTSQRWSCPVLKTEYLQEPGQSRDARSFVSSTPGLRNVTLIVPGKLDLAWDAGRRAARHVLHQLGGDEFPPECEKPWRPVHIDPATLSLVADPYAEHSCDAPSAHQCVAAPTEYRSASA